MKCPFCGNTENKVVDSRVSKEGDIIRRRRECDKCGDRFTTHERIEEMLPLIIKKDGSREEFDRGKLVSGLQKALTRRPVPASAADETADSIEAELRARGANEVPSSLVGELAMERLRHLDQIAYIRFASVYQSFDDIEQLGREVDRLLSDRSEAGVAGVGPKRTP
jgi:transcriptional repressor NrdR